LIRHLSENIGYNDECGNFGHHGYLISNSWSPGGVGIERFGSTRGFQHVGRKVKLIQSTQKQHETDSMYGIFVIFLGTEAYDTW